MIRVPKSNCQRFGFQAIRIQTTITIQIRLKDKDWVDDHDFDLISISFQLKLIDFDLFSIKRSIYQLKNQKYQFKDQNCQFIFKKVNLFWLFLIIFYLFLSHWNQFGHDESVSDDEFGSKKLIKKWWDHDIKRNLALDWLHRRSLVSTSGQY